MDFIEYAKWGIRVKEEPGTIELHLDKSNGNNFGESQGGWMCKFPCDAQVALDAAVTDSLPYELFEPFEIPPTHSVEEDQECFSLHGSNRFTSSTVSEGNNNTIALEHPSNIIPQDESTKNRSGFHNNIEENQIVTNLSRCRENLKINVPTNGIQMLDNVLNVQCDVNEDSAPGTNVASQRENVPKTVSERSDEVAFISKNQNEIFNSSNVKLLYRTIENDAAIANVKNKGTLDETLIVKNGVSVQDATLIVKNGLSVESDSPTGDSFERIDQQNGQKENNNEFRISDISIFECPDCSEVLKTFNGFIAHMNSHIMQQRKDIVSEQCKYCKEKFEDKRSLSLHKKVCKYAKENMIPSQNELSDNVTCLSESGLRKNSCATNEKYILEDNLEVSSHSQKTFQTNVSEQQSCQHQDLVAFSRKRRQPAHAEECSPSQTAESDSWTVQNLGAADDAFDVSWSSEIKCREEEKGKSSRSVQTLSLRLFRFRKPKVVVKRAQVPVRNESDIINLEDSSNDITEKSLCNERSVISNSSKQLTKEPETSEAIKLSKFDSSDTNCTNVLKPSRKQKNVLSSQKSWSSAGQHIAVDDENCNLQLQTSSTVVHEPQFTESPLLSDAIYSFSAKLSETGKHDEICEDASNKFPPKEMKGRSNLKIKIKPVVVLDRLSSFNSNNSSNKCKEETSKDVQCESFEKNLSKGINIGMDLSTCEKYKAKSKSTVKTLEQQSAGHHDPYPLINDMKESESGRSLEDYLQKQYHIKKCYVKLERISMETDGLKRIEKHNYNKDDTVRPCGKIKLRRMSSKTWAVSSCNSALENMQIADNTEDCVKVTEQICAAKSSEYLSSDVVQSDIYGQRFKRCVENDESRSSPISSSESPEGTLHKQMLREQRLKRLRSECNWCHKTFFNEQDLEQHIETHLSGYKCPNCSARFHFVMELRAHVAGCSLASLLDCHKAQSQIKPCQVVL